MTPQSLDSIELTQDGRVVGDRVLGFRFRNAGDPSDWSWQTKQNFVGLVNTPELATLSTEFDHETQFLRIHARDILIAEGLTNDPAARAEIESNFTDFVMSLDINPLAGHPERYPVTLVGDGVQPLFHDTAAGLVTLHSEESLAAVGASLNANAFDGRRFRSNIVVTGPERPFDEMSWVNRNVTIGDNEFKVIKPVTRCLVTHANPVTGQRDHDVMNNLVSNFTPEKPQFAVTLKLISGDRKLHTGDLVRVIS